MTKSTGVRAAQRALTSLGKKRCPVCRETKLLSAFGSDRSCRDGRNAYCRLCQAAHNKEMHYKHLYGLTQEQVLAGLRAHGGRCCVCLSENSGDKRGRWHVDHDHVTGKPRGVLCHHCNLMMGHARDNPDTLRRAIRYLEEAALYSDRGRFHVLLEMFS